MSARSSYNQILKQQRKFVKTLGTDRLERWLKDLDLYLLADTGVPQVVIKKRKASRVAIDEELQQRVGEPRL